MTESITDLLKTQDEINYATNIGQNVHKKMQHVFVDNDIWHGDKNITDKISQHAELTRFFTKNAKKICIYAKKSVTLQPFPTCVSASYHIV